VSDEFDLLKRWGEGLDVTPSTQSRREARQRMFDALDGELPSNGPGASRLKRNRHRRRIRKITLLAAIVGLSLTTAVVGAQLDLYQTTKGETGEQLRTNLGLSPTPLVDGEPPQSLFDTCQAPGQAIVEVPSGGAVCVGRGADLRGQFEAWDLSHRLRGDVPTEAEREAKWLQLRGAELEYQGDHEGAMRLYSRAADLLTGVVEPQGQVPRDGSTTSGE